jgi:hypothetical protein
MIHDSPRQFLELVQIIFIFSENVCIFNIHRRGDDIFSPNMFNGEDSDLDCM